MRGIKFRVWHPDESEMYYFKSFVEIVEWQGGFDCYFNGDKGGIDGYRDENPKFGVVNFMQYTGLKDKNRREIYEGDLYSFKIETEMFNGVKPIRKLSNRFIKVIEYKDGAFYHGADLLADVIKYDNSFEYVGNIFENPELLGDTHER